MRIASFHTDIVFPNTLNGDIDHLVTFNFFFYTSFLYLLEAALGAEKKLSEKQAERKNKMIEIKTENVDGKTKVEATIMGNPMTILFEWIAIIHNAIEFCDRESLGTFFYPALLGLLSEKEKELDEKLD